ncbi:thiol:disulfide interchange protein [Altererythrobacter confluentis]|uniref:Thiol:disulfide interchange protein n=1 Tax=Allopontixanthobacter confluentis TaxID=1849021 RepID=A0A6L7GJ17_9SPHN|nr:protein-disulfide reductase DsbD domain-containing protein [Allopontixanthobacter confluentis]MXP14651.1 thiol:disulfide interchange protein [Allopontixanthobacter confluentis]
MDKTIIPIRLVQKILALMAVAVALVMALAVPAVGVAQEAARPTHIAAQLAAEGPIAAGQTVMVAIHFTPDDGWHGYWRNPGDAGYGMQLKWQLPAGWQASEPEYPVPRQLLISGLMNHVYKGPYAVLVPLHVPAGTLPQTGVPIALDAQWLACTDVICVPENAQLQFRLATSGTASDAPRFAAWRAAIPALLDQRAAFEITDELLRLAIPVPATLPLERPHIFLGSTDIINYAAPQRFSRRGNQLIAEIPLALRGDAPDAIEGILAFDEDDGVHFGADKGAVGAAGVPVAPNGAMLPSLLVLLLGAAAGGLLLNIMPCVFPILSLKALSLARAGENERQARKEALAYSAGVILACTALGGLVLALRAAGEQVGWAFQLQEPGVVVGLLVLAAAITANLAGMFELPSVSVTRSGEPASAFATGVLAAVVATPCTGPFMAAALGAALLLPPVEAMVLFAALGLGLALPFLAVGFIPAVRRLLPAPGPWMARFRHIMAIPMGLTAAALAWLIWRLAGAEYAFLAIGISAAVVASLAALGSGQRAGTRSLRFTSVAGIIAAIVLAFGLADAYDPPQSARSETALIDAKPFSQARLDAARSTGKPVFVWFTADWCLSCKVNESVAIEREATRDAFAKAGVIALVGDWTRRDPEITRFLTSHGAAGVPLYLWYPPGGSAQQLGQVLGPETLVTLVGTGPVTGPISGPISGERQPSVSGGTLLPAGSASGSD